MDTLSLDQLNAFINSGVTAPAVPPPPIVPPAPQPSPAAASVAPPVYPTSGPFNQQYPELRVVDGIADVHELSVVIARSCRQYGTMKVDNGNYIIRTYKHEFKLTPTEAFWNGVKVWWYQRIHDAVRILQGQQLAIGRSASLQFDYAYRMACTGYFAKADMPVKPTPLSD